MVLAGPRLPSPVIDACDGRAADDGYEAPNCTSGLDHASDHTTAELVVDARSADRAGLDAAVLIGAAGSGIGPRPTGERRAVGCCAQCGRAQLCPWGHTEAGRRRWRCPACARTCSGPAGEVLPAGAGTGRHPARLRSPDAFARVREDMLTNRRPGTCRGLAAALAVDRMTVWRWRRRIIESLARAALPVDGVAGIAACRRLRESRKGARLWVDHRRDPAACPTPHRPRWVDVDRHGEPLPRPLWTYQNDVLLAVDAGEPCRSRIRPATAAPPAGDSDDGLGSAFEQFLSPFRGPAAVYLDGYAAWFAKRLDMAGS